MSVLNIIPGLKSISPLTYNQYLFETPGTYQWVCPPFVSQISVVCIGGGGGGGRDGAGGGGGGLAYHTAFNVTPGQSYTVVVGAGGSGGPSPTNGGDSSFNSTIIGGGGKAPTGILGGEGGTFSGGTGGGQGGFGGGYTLTKDASPAGGQGQNGGGGGGAGGYGYAGGYGSGSILRTANASTQGGGGGGAGCSQVFGNGNGTPSGGGGGGSHPLSASRAGSIFINGGLAGTSSFDYTVAPTGGLGGDSATSGEPGSANFTNGNVGGAGGLYGGGGGGSSGSGNSGGFSRSDTNSGGRGAVGIIINSSTWGSYPTSFKSFGNASSTIITRRIGAFSKLPTLGTGGATYPPVGYTVIQNSSVDDNFLTITLPFTFYFNGTAYTTIYVGSNSYLTFGGGSGTFSGLSATVPALNKIMLAAGDKSYQRVSYITDNANYLTIRFEGTNATSGTLGSPNLVYEATLFNPAITDNNRSIIELCLGSFVSVGTGVTGIYSAAGTSLGTLTLSQNQSYILESTDSTGSSWVSNAGCSYMGFR